MNKFIKLGLTIALLLILAIGNRLTGMAGARGCASSDVTKAENILENKIEDIKNNDNPVIPEESVQTGEKKNAEDSNLNEDNQVTDTQPESDIADNAGNTESDNSNEEISQSNSADGAENVDVDLTTLSKILVYSEVYNMMVTPDDYIGKTVKMRGQLSIYEDESTGNIYFACIVKDATACCSQGIEFVLTDEYVYPDDYPAEGEEITVTGVFNTYQEGDVTYCNLINAKLISE